MKRFGAISGLRARLLRMVPAALSALKLYRGRRHRNGTGPRAEESRAPAKRRGPSPLPVIWSGLVVVKLLSLRMTINDHAAARDSHRRDDRGDQPGKGTRRGFRPAPPPPVCPEHLPSPLSFRKRNTSGDVIFRRSLLPGSITNKSLTA